MGIRTTARTIARLFGLANLSGLATTAQPDGKANLDANSGAILVGVNTLDDRYALIADAGFDGGQVDNPVGIGGPAYSDPGLDRIKLTLWGPSGSLGHAAINLRCVNDGSDVNAYGALMVSHDEAYNGTPGYARWTQFYAGTGANGTILGCNTDGGYIRIELGPTWPESEVCRIRDVGTNKADWIIGWALDRTITASQSGTTVTATVGTFTAADEGKWLCWGTNTSGTNADTFKITTYISATQVTVDTSRPGGITSQQARICTPLLLMDSAGGLVTSGAVGIGGPKYENAGRWPLICYGTTGSTGYGASFVTTDQTTSGGLPNLGTLFGTYVYSTTYIQSNGVQSWAEQVAVQGLRGLSTGSLAVDNDWRVVLGPDWPGNEVIRAHYRGTNQADVSFNPVLVRNHTASQTATTVTATVGSFVSTDVGNYVCWPVLGEMYRITGYSSATVVTVDRSPPGGSIASTAMKVYRAPALIAADGSLTALSITQKDSSGTTRTSIGSDGLVSIPVSSVGSPNLQLTGAGSHMRHIRTGVSDVGVGIGGSGGDDYTIINYGTSANMLTINPTSKTATLFGALRLAQKTIATLPSAASSARQRFEVTDSAPVTGRIAFSNGTAWYYEDGTAV